jgi:predicted RND superfamily exporter protein
MFGIYFSILTTTLPVFLIALGSAYGIHLINDYYAELRIERHNFTKEEHKAIIYASIHKVGKPIILAGITTLIGFGSLATSPIIPLKHFSLFSCIGVATALIVTMTFIPSLLLVRKHALNAKTTAKKSKLDNLFSYLAEAVERKKILIFIMAGAIIIVSVFGISKVIVDNILIANFKKTEDIRVADKMIRANFGGTKIFNVIIDGKEKGAMTDPEILKAMDDLDSYLENNFEDVGKVLSFTDFLKRMNKVMNYPAVDSETLQTEDSFSEDSAGSSFFDGEEVSSFVEEEETSFFSDDLEKDVSKNNIKPEIDYASMLNKKITANEFMELLDQKLSDAETTDPYADEIISSFFSDYNFKGETYNEIPYDISKYPVESKEELKNLISQYLLLYSGSLESYSNDAIEPSKALMVVQLKTMNTIPVKEMSKIIMDYTDKNFPEGYNVSIAGYADMETALTTLITKSQISSLILSLILVFIIVAMAFKSPVAGLFAVIPLSFAILINFAVMGFAGIRLDLVTTMIASIAVGIGIDYTIHFLSSYKHERLLTNDIKVVTEKTMLSTGKAILFNAAAVAAGFMVLTFSNFTTLRYIGLLVALTMFTSSTATLTLLPVLLNIFKPSFIRNK